MIEHHVARNPIENPVCSICVANYNGVGLLDDCIGSVFGQQGSVAFEIIVHDDASTDGSVQLLREKYPQVELLVSHENVGFCISNNRMAAQARGEYLLLLNNDAALYPDALTTLLAIARAAPSDQILTLPQYDWETGELVDCGSLLDPFYNAVPNLDKQRGDVAMAIGACLWISRALWNDLGGFPEWMESIAEDLHLCCAARLLGIEVRAVGNSGFRHRQGASFSGLRSPSNALVSTYRRRHLSERNKTAVMIVCTPTPLMWVLLIIHLVALATEALVLLLVRRDAAIWLKIYWPALKGLWHQRQHLLGNRGATQRQRRISAWSYFREFRPLPHKLMLLLRHGLPRLR